MSARWNDETQSWEPVGGVPSPAPAPPPMPTTGPAPAPASGPAAPVPPPPSYTPEYVPETGQWQYPTASPAGDAAGRPRARGAVAAGVAVAVLAAGSVGTWLLWGRSGDGNGPAAGGPAVSVSAPVETTPSAYPTDGPDDAEPSYGTDTPTGSPTDSPTPSGSATAPSDGVAPPGYRVQKDLKGFTVGVPEGWDRTESDQGIFYNAPGGKSLLQVFVVTEPGMTPYEALRGASEDGKANKPGYVEISLDRVTGDPAAPADAAELVYSYERDGGRRKVVDRAFTAADGNHYAILAAGPETDWPKQREVLRVALEFFRPGAY
ncbi:serine/arginine repetitive matrix protein 2 [Streptomyces narbonensis]|uniref:serine/arginine repetitive matrix protein 2 n=1 Tax=Streptomyces narbonensis TaxID=67333 RepID=UPI00167535AD|nr:serine/arginine repetitive matrix protein 2 [Streptomyces narbonensis]GGW10603.1 hypothetical protein GCM10010230_62210 [Streptomyces narbonensis]